MLAALPWKDITPFALLLAAVAMVFMGQLVPRRTHERMLAQERQRADEWKAIADTRGDELKINRAQLTEMLELGRTTNAFIGGLKSMATPTHPEP
jgi:hypothetical protein